jgi:hypothetical protein
MATETDRDSRDRALTARDLIARGRKTRGAVKGALMVMQLLAAAIIILAEVRDQVGDREVPLVEDARSRVKALAARLRPATRAEETTAAEKETTARTRK